MDAVRVVPHDAEVGGGSPHGAETVHGFIAVNDALGVGVQGNAPDALDGRIFRHQFFHQIHIGSVFGHGNGDHFDTQILADAEVAVVTGAGTEEFDFIQLGPGGVPAGAEEHETDHGIIHQIEAGVAADNDLFRGDVQQTGEQFFCFRDAIEPAVVPCVHAIFCDIFCQGEEDPVGQVKLRARGFATGHIQFQVLCLKVCVLLFQIFLEGKQFHFGKFCDVHGRFRSCQFQFHAAPAAAL